MSFRILILGGNGMIGHKLYQNLVEEFFDTWVILRKDTDHSKYINLYNNKKIIYIDSVLNFNYLYNIIKIIKPDLIINAVGITTRRFGNIHKHEIIQINSIFPNLLEKWAIAIKFKLIQLSTDCVFTGDHGNYTENDITDSIDLYGKTKSLGEIETSSVLTIRSSMIGPELCNHTELFDWLISNNNNKIVGYKNAIYSGITTKKMSNYIIHIIKNNFNLSGIFNISSIPINKYDLLKMLIFKLNLNIVINEDFIYKTNKALVSEKFFNYTNLKIENWESLSDELILDYNKNLIIYNK